MTAIEIIVIVACVAVILGVLIAHFMRKARAKQAGVPYTCACCEHVKKIKDIESVCSGHCASCHGCSTMRDKGEKKE